MNLQYHELLRIYSEQHCDRWGYIQPPGHHLEADKVGLCRMNSWVWGSKVAVVSNPRRWVPGKENRMIRHTICLSEVTTDLSYFHLNIDNVYYVLL